MRPVAYVLAAPLIASTVAACGGGGATSSGPAPTIPDAAKRVGFIGLPPKGAQPSTPPRGRLVAFWWASAPGDWGKGRFWLFADGRLISLREADIPEGANPRSTGFLEQRITPEGVGILRSAVVGSNPPRLTWAVTSELPKRAWADRTLRAYVPWTYAVCSDEGDAGALGHHPQTRGLRRLWSLLPARAKDVLRGNEMDAARSREPIEHCWDLTTKEARALAVALDDDKFERSQQAHAFSLAYESKRSDPADPELAVVYISFEPILPHGEWTCSPCG